MSETIVKRAVAGDYTKHRIGFSPVENQCRSGANTSHDNNNGDTNFSLSVNNLYPEWPTYFSIPINGNEQKRQNGTACADGDAEAKHLAGDRNV